ncbi:hypothetical protein ACOME3_007218 [Neoechinorhynchus agilis]
MTNRILTQQKRGYCPEDPDLSFSLCKNDSDCVPSSFRPKQNGKVTGKCVFADRMFAGKKLEKVCQVRGWCPIENDIHIPQSFRHIPNLTILVKNYIEFPAFGVIRKNFVPELSPRYFRSCIHHEVTDPLCPIFKVGRILEAVEKNKTELQLMLKYGCAIRLKIQWNCNLDLAIHRCVPNYEFRRIDAPFYVERFSAGYNFRYSDYWKLGAQEQRLLTKAYGIRLVVNVNGAAGKFDIIAFSMNIGSIVGILGLATLVCDIVVLSFGKNRKLVREQKYQVLDVMFLAPEHRKVKRLLTRSWTRNHSSTALPSHHVVRPPSLRHSKSFPEVEE